MIIGVAAPAVEENAALTLDCALATSSSVIIIRLALCEAVSILSVLPALVPVFVTPGAPILPASCGYGVDAGSTYACSACILRSTDSSASLGDPLFASSMVLRVGASSEMD